jgi:hypothetical protein
MAAGHFRFQTLLFVGVGGTLVVALTIYCFRGEKTHERKSEFIEPSIDDSSDGIQRHLPIQLRQAE